MNILHLLSQTHLTGPEVYVAALCEKHAAQGHRCFVISDTLSTKVNATYEKLDIHNRHYLNRIKNIFLLLRFCKNNQIDLIHAHSRAASWLANIVSKMIPVTYISTVHGRQSVHASSKRANVYGKHIIVICEHLQEHLQQDLNITNAEFHLVRNGID